MSTAGDDAVGVPPACGGRSDAVGVPQLARESGAMRDQDCSGELLRSPTHNGHLLVGALKRHQNKPVLFLGDTRLTGGQLADRISQYIQAFEALGAGTGVAVGLLSLNRPEVLMIIGAGQARGYRRTALHPLGSLADHAYVLNDAGISSLIIDPNPMFVERALALLEQVDSLQQILTIGPVPDALKHVAVDLSAEAAKYQPQPLVAADLPPDQVIGLTYTGGTTGKPKGVIGTAQSIATMTSIQLAEWEWPANPRFLMCTPLSHAGAAFFTPTVIKGGEMIVLAKFDPAEVLRIIEEQRITATMLVPSMLYALLDHPLSHAGAAFFTPTVIKGGEMIVLAKFDPAEVLRIIEEQRITATMLVPSMLYALLDHPDSHTRDLSS
ncbi:AMP-binding protein, partial [Mycobacterium tuberculosis]|uniref:AMP-binding protein n=1 Tax=Mycobacterium tuberculosis TaxID=1773 RepID=UPI00125FCF02